MGGKKEGLLNLKINGRESHSSVSSVNEAELIPLDMNNNPMTKMTSSGGANNCGELVLRKARHLEDDDDTTTSSSTNTKIKRNGSGGSGGGAGGSVGHINLNDDEDDDEVEDLAKMISCFALLMPNRITAAGSERTPTASSSSSNGSAAQSSSHARQDIMITAAAAASALGMGQIKRTSSSLFSRLGKNT